LIPRGIGVVTSLGAAALHDVVSALQRRAPHVPVLLSPSVVQGAAAPAELVAALRSLYPYAAPQGHNGLVLDTILLVRGGGSMEDLWAFNDEALARTIAESPVPVVSGVGHETDFTIADWVADVRAPTPTAAAELAAQTVADLRGPLSVFHLRLESVVGRTVDTQTQRIDRAAARLGRPSALSAAQRQLQTAQGRRLRLAVQLALRQHRQALKAHSQQLPQNAATALEHSRARQQRAQARLALVDPALVLQRGYAWLQDASGHTISAADAVHPGQVLKATLAEGRLDLTVQAQR
ncbi:MAG: exodeoxyribonuclease VII large subunit, partial [Burkholderiaceae bacterium]